MRTILYKTITQTYIDTLIIGYGVCFPVFLFSLFRFHLSGEKITVTRGTLHASFTLFSVGAVSLGLGVSVLLARHLGLKYSYFGLFLFLFSAIFFTLLITSSPDMRKRVFRAVNTRIYRSKYDYQQQFFRLHQTYLSGSNLSGSINALIENMKDTLTVKNVYIFIFNNEDANFHLHKNPDTLSDKDFIIQADSKLVAAFKDDTTPIDLIAGRKNSRASKVLEDEKKLSDTLDISMIFPILHENSLYGLLMFKHTRGICFDNEDINLINAFSLSIGDVFNKFRVLQEQIEAKQFESFNYISSFILHDIKNQVATLSLLTNNATTNINKPDFQNSLMLSLQNCTQNLQKLIDKFTSPLKGTVIELQPHNINTIIEEYLTDSGIGESGTITLNLSLQANSLVTVDKDSFFYIVVNIITNSIEAMKNKGTLTITTNDITSFDTDLLQEFNISKRFLSGKQVYILIEDTGKGMAQDFIDTKLFHPFTSTKDKGVGIGLYQCKVLLEKMGGKILCKSQVHKGARFLLLI